MRIGASLFLLAAGAILAFAVRDTLTNVDLTMVGVILMAVGAIGLIISLVLATSRQRTDVIHDRQGTTIIEPNPYNRTV